MTYVGAAHRRITSQISEKANGIKQLVKNSIQSKNTNKK